MDNLYTKQQLREGIINGIRKCASAIGGTMGSCGANVIVEAQENPGYMVTNDGWTILNSIKFADPLEEIGRKILLEAVSKANKQSGDGSSGTTVLCAAIIEEGLKYLTETSAIDLKRSLDELIPVIEAKIKEMAKEITVDELKAVCTTSAEDEKIGTLIQEIYQKIGKDGLIYWDISKTSEDSYTIGSGITVGAGFISPYLCDIDEKSMKQYNYSKLKAPKVLIVEEKITNSEDFSKIVGQLTSQGDKELLVFCDEIEATVVQLLVKTRFEKGFRIVLVKMPVVWKDWWYQDLAIASGATVINHAKGINLKNAELKHLGSFENVVVTQNETYIDGIKNVTQHVADLIAEGSDDSKVRASRLNTKTARLFIGAHTEAALAYKRLKVEDAINAGYQALHGGIVAGGGVTLARATTSIPLTIGGEVLQKALKAPFMQILKNANVEIPELKELDINSGIDTRTKKVVDMFSAGIVDPAQVIINSVKNAISVAGTVLTAEAATLLPPPDQTLPNNMLIR